MRKQLRMIVFMIMTFICATVTIPIVAQFDAACERIILFDARINMQDDGSMVVKEEITVQSCGQKIRHGIVREFPTIYIDAKGAAKYITDFQVKEVLLNGKPVTPAVKKNGFYELTKEWKTGDMVSISGEYLFDHKIRSGQDGKNWIAFSYGPWALAQEIDSDSIVEEPFKNLDLRSIDSRSILSFSQGVSTKPEVRVKSTNIVLIPYYLAGSKTTGSRTYFTFD